MSEQAAALVDAAPAKVTPVSPCAYFCKYTPLELLVAFGLDPRLTDMECDQFEQAEMRTHVNLCSHAKMLVEASLHDGDTVLMDCCDSVRRVFDVLHAEDAGREERLLALVDLPHDEGTCATKRFAAALTRLAHVLECHTGNAFSPTSFAEACSHSVADVSGLIPPEEPFFAVVGARASSGLLESIRTSLDAPVADLTCSGNRTLMPLPEELHQACMALDADTRLEGVLFDACMDWYAHALLAQMPCMRMNDVARRRELTEHPRLVGIVYNTVKFCDFYGFDYIRLKDEVFVPILKIESDYRPQPPGQLSTRLEAFRESIAGMNGRVQAAEATRTWGESALEDVLYGGIDSGSTSTNMVIINLDGDVVASAIVRTGPKAALGAEAALASVKEQLGERAGDIHHIFATGYGRGNIPFAADTVTEITCHARGAHALAPHVRTIVDIGGQDSKVIRLNDDGTVANFIMNDKCAAGTGRFLEAMARTLELSLPALAQAGRSWKEDLTISAMCTVFAESEVISLIADNHTDDDIVHGLNKSIASRTASMVARAKGEAPFMMTGGVARNAGVVTELERKLGTEIYVGNEPDLCGALGAALLAREASI